MAARDARTFEAAKLMLLSAWDLGHVSIIGSDLSNRTGHAICEETVGERQSATRKLSVSIFKRYIETTQFFNGHISATEYAGSTAGYFLISYTRKPLQQQTPFDEIAEMLDKMFAQIPDTPVQPTDFTQAPQALQELIGPNRELKENTSPDQDRLIAKLFTYFSIFASKILRLRSTGETLLTGRRNRRAVTLKPMRVVPRSIPHCAPPALPPSISRCLYGTTQALDLSSQSSFTTHSRTG